MPARSVSEPSGPRSDFETNRPAISRDRRDRRLHARPAGIGASLTLLLAILFAGCSDRVQNPSTVVSAEPPFQTQLASGRAGDSDRITLQKQIVTDEAVAGLRSEDVWLKTIQFDAGMISDTGAQSIAQVPSLRHLRLRQSPITDRGMEAISECNSLQILNLPQCDATAKGITALHSLSKLWSLRLGGPRLGADSAEAIAGIQSIRSLHLIGVPIDDAGLRLIVTLPQLESLYIDDADVSQAGWDWLFETFPDLHVHVNQKHLDRDPGKH